MKESLIPLPQCLSEVDVTNGREKKTFSTADKIRNWIPTTPSGIKCVTDAQKLQILLLIENHDGARRERGDTSISDFEKILGLARDIYHLAVKDCLHCSTKNCLFRDEKPAE